MLENHKNARRISEVVLFIAFLIGLAIAYTWKNKEFSADDSFITFRYAIHLMQGDGLVFNVGEKYYGTTAAGYAIFIALLSKIAFAIWNTLTVQNVAVALSAISLAIVPALLFILTPRKNFWSITPLLLCGCIGVCLLTALPFHEVAGHETYTFLSAAFIATYLASRKKMLAGGFACALAATFRPDAILFAPIICIVFVIFSRLHPRDIFKSRELWQFAAGVFSILVPWIAAMLLYYGRPFPGTMDAKRAQFLMGYWPIYNWDNVVDYLNRMTNYNSAIVMAAGVSLFAIGFFLSRKGTDDAQPRQQVQFIGICWAAFTILSVAFYFNLKVTFWDWYGAPVLFSLIVIATVGCFSMGGMGDSNNKIINTGWLIAAVCIGGYLLAGYYPRLKSYANSGPHKNDHTSAYSEIADYLRKAEPDGTVVEMAEPGAFAVRLGSKFKIIDELGLITPGVSKAYLQGDHEYVSRVFKPKYIVCSWLADFSACSKPNVMKDYTLIGEFNKDFWKEHVVAGAATLYRRKE